MPYQPVVFQVSDISLTLSYERNIISRPIDPWLRISTFDTNTRFLKRIEVPQILTMKGESPTCSSHFSVHLTHFI